MVIDADEIEISIEEATPDVDGDKEKVLIWLVLTPQSEEESKGKGCGDEVDRKILCKHCQLLRLTTKKGRRKTYSDTPSKAPTYHRLKWYAPTKDYYSPAMPWPSQPRAKCPAYSTTKSPYACQTTE